MNQTTDIDCRNHQRICFHELLCGSSYRIISANDEIWYWVCAATVLFSLKLYRWGRTQFGGINQSTGCLQSVSAVGPSMSLRVCDVRVPMRHSWDFINSMSVWVLMALSIEYEFCVKHKYRRFIEKCRKGWFQMLSLTVVAGIIFLVPKRYCVLWDFWKHRRLVALNCWANRIQLHVRHPWPALCRRP